jgi:hypothetical protein
LRLRVKDCRSGWSSASVAAILVEAVAVQPDEDLGEPGDVAG